MRWFSFLHTVSTWVVKLRLLSKTVPRYLNVFTLSTSSVFIRTCCNRDVSLALWERESEIDVGTGERRVCGRERRQEREKERESARDR